MHDPVTVSRRQTLKFLSGVPMLPIASSLAGVAFPVEADAFGPNAIIEFNAMAAPTLAHPDEMARTFVKSTVTKVGPRRSQTYAIGYQTFFLTGDSVPATGGGSIIAGGHYDIKNRPIIDTTSPTQRQFFSDAPDGMSLIELKYARSGRPGHRRIFAVVQFEYTTKNVAGESTYGQLPSPIAVLSIDQDKNTGELKLVSYHNVDTSPVHGLWITCGASRSPWGTHLSSEEYEPDATTIATNTQFRAYSQNLFGSPTAANPYHYGHVPEVTVLPDGTGVIKKHYCLGRISHELIEVMPDQRTALMGDDATNGGLFMFVADRPRDLSAGTLYVAKWLQKTAANGGSADLKWIRLGHATSKEIEALADSLTPADIVDVKTSDPADSRYTRIPFSGTNNWVKFDPLHLKAAAFLETHRYAAYKGASMGFTKMEGTTVNIRDRIAYSAISDIQTAMTDGSGGIAVQGPRAGMVYAWKLRGGQSDTDGARIDSAWVPVSGAPLLIGEDLATPDSLGNLSNADKIANPDNLKFSEKLRTLFIGEDSGRHVNNFLWAYNVDSGKLSRILSCPAGAECTGLHAVDDVAGFSYVMTNFQHAGDWESPVHDRVKKILDPMEAGVYRGKVAAAVGYLAVTDVLDDGRGRGRG